MKKRLLSLFLAAAMAMCLGGCQTGEVNETDEPNQGQIDVDGEGSGVEDPLENEGETVENVNVMDLNAELRATGEALAVESPEKVLKFTTVSTGDTRAKQLIVNISEIQIPVGATLEYESFFYCSASILFAEACSKSNLFFD